MKKLQSARDHLLASPLGITADSLLTFAEDGTVTSHCGADSASFSVAYTANLIVTDYTGPLSGLLFVVLQWMHRTVPTDKPDALKFHVDVVNHKSYDVWLKLDLVDVVRAVTTSAGTELTGQTDPDALAFDMSALAPGLQ